MPVSADPYAQIKTINPLDTVGSFLNLQSKVQKNALTKMELQGKTGLGKAIQAATGDDGAVDTAKLSNILKDPNNYAAAAEGAALGLDLKGKQLTNAQAGQTLNAGANEILGNVWGARLNAAPDKTTARDLREDVLDLAIAGRIPKDYALKVVQMIPDDPKAAKEFALKGFLTSLGPAGQAGLTPAAPGADLAPRSQTAGQFVAGTLGTDEAGAAGGAPPLTAAPAGAPPAAGAAPRKAPGVVTGASPTYSDAAIVTARNSAEQYNNLINLGNEVPNRKAMLNNMLDDAQLFTSGPVSDELYRLTAGVNEIFGTKFSVDAVSGKERFDKLSNQIALAQAGVLGVNATDMTKNMSVASNPHSGLSQSGVRSVISMLLGNEDAIQVKKQMAMDSNISPDQYLKWSNDFNKHFDPRIFQSVYMSPTELNVMLKSMKGQTLAEFRQKYNYAVANGWIPNPAEGGQ